MDCKIMSEKRKQQIQGLLREEKVKTIRLVGAAGVGKTWLARQVSNDATAKGLSGCTLWVHRKKVYDMNSICQDLGRQFRLLCKEKPDDDNAEKVTLSKRVIEILQEKKKEVIAQKKSILVILDDVLDENNANESLSLLKLLLDGGSTSPEAEMKVLMTVREKSTSGQTAEDAVVDVDIEPLSHEISLALLKQFVDEKVKQCPRFETLSEAIVKKTKGLPAAVIAVAGALNSVTRPSSVAPEAGLEAALREAAADYDREPGDVSHIIRWCYKMLPDKVLPDCFWHARELFVRLGGGDIHYNELIAHWILEGHFSHVDGVDEAYMEAHEALIELIERGFLRSLGDNFVAMEPLALEFPANQDCNLGGMSGLGLVRVFEDGNLKGLGRILRTEGMIRMLPNQTIDTEEPASLILDGTTFGRCEELLQYSRDQNQNKNQRLFQDTQVCFILRPKFRALPSSLVNMDKNLLVLVLRGWDLMDSIMGIEKLTSLTVLEISGACSLREIPEGLFELVRGLMSLNLSESRIQSLPSSFSNLTELRWLILRNCPVLETLPSIKDFTNFQALDLSGSTSLRKIQDRSFEPLKKLELLDFSQAQIDRLPIIGRCISLTHLLLRGCAKLFRLPSLPSGLQVLDISKASFLKEFQSPIEHGAIRVLNLSGCSGLEKLPSTKSFAHLELLDLSGATNLEGLEDQSFKNLKCLTVLNLSRTKIKSLPALVDLSNLQKLLLSDCKFLEALPIMKELERLEELDLSGATSLVELEDKAFEHLKCLGVLNLCRTKVKTLPSLNLGNLYKLLLKDCELLEGLPTMTGLTMLEELDISDAPFLRRLGCGGLSNLQKLLLPGCAKLSELSSLTDLKKLEVLDLSRCTDLRAIGEESSFAEMSCLRSLDISETLIERLPSLGNLQNLHHLILRDCTALKLEDFKFLNNMTCIEKLDLSGVKFDRSPPVSNLVNLTHLSLRGCLDLKELPDLAALTTLKVLDLTGTAVKRVPYLDTLVGLSHLYLRGCSDLEPLQDLSPLTRLEVLDLCGVKVEDFPYWTQELKHLKELYLPDLKSMKGLDLSKINRIPQELNWEECGILHHALDTDNSKLFMSVSGTGFFEFLNKYPPLWETCFKRFNFSVHPEHGDHPGCCRDRSVMDTYFKIRHFPAECERSIEVRGLKRLSNTLKTVFGRAEYLSFIDIQCLNHLSDLDPDNMKILKGCWLESCNEMEGVFNGKERDLVLGMNLEILWASNLPKLRYLYSKDVGPEGWANLKKLSLDCCPMLEHVFSASQHPLNLEVLEIRFCEKLKTVFEFERDQTEAQKPNQLLNIKKLRLHCCPMLESVFSSSQNPQNLEFLEIRFCAHLKAVLENHKTTEQQPGRLHNLKKVYLDHCPMLVSMFHRSPHSENLEVLEIRSCQKLQQRPENGAGKASWKS